MVNRTLAARLPLWTEMEPRPTDTDQETVNRVLAGDINQFEMLMRRYTQRLYRVARAILGNEADAEDAVQQGYVNAYRQLRQFEGRAVFSTWLTRIVVHEALSRRRRLRARSTECLDSRLHDVVSGQHDPERLTYVTQLSALLQSAVKTLPDGYRSVFVMREIDGLTTTETAQRLGLTEGAAKARLHRAKGVLQQRLRASVRTK
jgi:RNA polymerase sigma-70 factor, ECF subfamily